jgi:metal-responsive CopG/Arc/MetJ family transcriptional regulator
MSTAQPLFPLPNSLYQQVEALANELQISQNEIFTLAIESYLHRYRNHKLQQSLDEAYTDRLDATEQAMLEGMRRHQRHLLEREP